MRPLLVGSFGAGNVGDHLILCAALARFPGAYVMTANAAETRHFVGYDIKTVPPPPTGFRSLLAYKKENYATLADVPQVIFAGGGLFAGGLRAYFVWAATALWLRKLCPKARFVWLGQGLDRTSNPIKRALTRAAMRGAQAIETRDVTSQAQAALLGLRAELGQDTARRYLNKKTKAKTPKTVYINAVRPIEPSRLATIKQRHKGDEINFLVFDERDQKHAPAGLAVTFPRTEKEVYDTFCRAKMVYAERLHVAVVAHSLGIKCALLRAPYAPKVKDFERYL